MYTLLILVYVYAALVVATLGRRTRLGFWRSLMVSLVITPPVAMLVLFLFYEARMTPARASPRRWPRLRRERSQS